MNSDIMKNLPLLRDIDKNMKVPPMGWNSWDCWGAAVNEATVRANAEFISKNLKQFGWEYVVVDIQWSEPNAKNHEYNPFTELCMDEYSRLIPDTGRFPSSACQFLLLRLQSVVSGWARLHKARPWRQG